MKTIDDTLLLTVLLLFVFGAAVLPGELAAPLAYVEHGTSEG